MTTFPAFHAASPAYGSHRYHLKGRVKARTWTRAFRRARQAQKAWTWATYPADLF